MRTCKGCGGEIPPTRATQARYCADKCRIRTNNRRHYADPAWREAHKEYCATPAQRKAQARRDRERHQLEHYGEVLGNNPLKKWNARHGTSYRSGLEVHAARQLEAAGISFSYESITIPYSPE